MPYLNHNVQNNYQPDIIFTDSSSSPQLEYEEYPADGTPSCHHPDTATSLVLTFPLADTGKPSVNLYWHLKFSFHSPHTFLLSCHHHKIALPLFHWVLTSYCYLPGASLVQGFCHKGTSPKTWHGSTWRTAPGVSLKWIKCLCYHFHPFPASASSKHSLTPQGCEAPEERGGCTPCDSQAWSRLSPWGGHRGQQGPVNKLPSTSAVSRFSDNSQTSCSLSLANTTNQPPQGAPNWGQAPAPSTRDGEWCKHRHSSYNTWYSQPGPGMQLRTFPDLQKTQKGSQNQGSSTALTRRGWTHLHLPSPGALISRLISLITELSPH